MENPKRARSWKRRLRPRVNLKNDVPVLYSTQDPGSHHGIALFDSKSNSGERRPRAKPKDLTRPPQ